MIIDFHMHIGKGGPTTPPIIKIDEAPNKNGVYKIGFFSRKERSISCFLRFFTDKNKKKLKRSTFCNL